MKTHKIIVILLTLLFNLMVPSSRGEEPDHKMIDYRFFKCEKSRDLRGGIYGKGPFKRFGPDKSKCRKTEWVEINQEEFKNLAAKWYGYDWSQEIPFWRDTKKGARGRRQLCQLALDNMLKYCFMLHAGM